MSVRMPRELDDVLHLVADRYRVAPRQFAPAVIRYYLTLACANGDMAQRLRTLSKTRLATGKCQKDLRLRLQRELLEWLRDIAVATEGATRSDMVRALSWRRRKMCSTMARESRSGNWRRLPGPFRLLTTIRLYLLFGPDSGY